MIKKISMHGLLLLSISALGLILMILVYLLPTNKMWKHAADSYTFFEEKGCNPQVILGFDSTTIDTYTDSWMFRIAVYDGNESVIERALLNKYKTFSFGEDGTVLDKTVRLLKGEIPDTVNTYSRYWHGYLIFLKPLLLFFNYADILQITKALCMLLAFILLIGITKNYGPYMAIPYGLVFVEIDIFTIGMSLQFMWVYSIAIIGACIMLSPRINKTYSYTFLLIGAITSFGDFLTYPLFTLGLPLLVLVTGMLLEDGTTYKDLGTKFFVSCVSWGAGYFGMWTTKWIWASLLTPENAIAFAFNSISERRGSINVNTFEEYTLWGAIERNLENLKTCPFVLVAGIVFFFLLARIIKNRKEITTTKLVKMLIVFGVISVLPLGWFIISVNHCWNHTHMVYRIFGISIGGAYSFLAMLGENEKITIHKS